MDPVLDELRAQAALRSGCPTLVAVTASEEDAERVRDHLAELLGPLPQAWLEEPFADDPRWRLRCTLPGLGGVAWSRAHQRLALDGVPCHLEHTDAPGVTEALERGWLEAELVEAGGATARRLLAGEVDRRPDLVRPLVDEPWIRAAGRAVAEAVRAVRPDLVPTSELGPDTLAPVVHRPTGRTGLELYLPAEPGDPLPDRVALLGALARVVAGLGLCPDLDWDAPMGGLAFRLWLAVPPGRALPGDGAARGRWDWDPADLVDHADQVELQLVPRRAGDHDRLVAEATRIAERAGLGGGPARWARVEDGEPARLAPTWLADHVPSEAVLAELRELPGAAALRRVPGAPHGLQDRWPAIDPAWRTAAGVCFCRWPDAVTERDRLERVADRSPDARDHAVADPSPLELRPIADTAGRHGLEVRGGAESLDERGLDELLARLGALHHPELSTLGSLGFGRRGAVVRRWFRTPEPDPSKIRAWAASPDAGVREER